MSPNTTSDTCPICNGHGRISNGRDPCDPAYDDGPCPNPDCEDGVIERPARAALVDRLLEGCVYHPKRWSGDTHDDLGGSIDEDATNALLREAAAALSAHEGRPIVTSRRN